MGYPEEPKYTVFDYACPHCGKDYTEAGSVRKHADFQKCPSCGKRASDPKTDLVQGKPEIKTERGKHEETYRRV